MAPRFAPVSTRSTAVRAITFTPLRFSSRVSVIEARRSHVDSTRSLRISSVTSQPAAFHSDANSNATAPAPIITALEGKVFSSNAWVESISAPANGFPGNASGRDPVANTTSSASIASSVSTGSNTPASTDRNTCVSPSAGVTRTVCAFCNAAQPRNTVTPRCASRPVSPFVIVSTVETRKSRNLPKSMLCSVALMPMRSALWMVSTLCTAVNNAFDGMHPRLRHVPPSVPSRSINATDLPSSAARSAVE